MTYKILQNFHARANSSDSDDIRTVRDDGCKIDQMESDQNKWIWPYEFDPFVGAGENKFMIFVSVLVWNEDTKNDLFLTEGFLKMIFFHAQMLPSHMII